MCTKAHIAAAIFAFLPLAVFADSIVVDGKWYRDVYVGSGAQLYYIQDPSDGSMITVPKSEVRPSDIHITEDRAERRKLRDMWKLKRLNRNKTTEPTETDEAWRAKLEDSLPRREMRQATMELDEPVQKNGIQAKQSDDGVVHFTNVKKNTSSSSLGGRKMFMNRDGVAIMTNKPEEFRGREEYVEVTIHYDPIAVPKQFREAPTQGRGALGGNTIDDMIAYYADRYRLDASLVYAIIKVESDGNQYAVSSAGARGLMQLMPGTAREMGVNDIFDPAENIAGGTQYLSKLLNLYEGNLTLALAGYNAGPGNVKKYGGVPPFKETQNYIRMVQRYERLFRRNGTPQFEVASAKPVDRGYLPPESREYYQIVLDNGLTVPAEQVYLDSGRYVYIFKGRSAHFPEDQVLAVYEPS